jgi:hypothetical protein
MSGSSELTTHVRGASREMCGRGNASALVNHNRDASPRDRQHGCRPIRAPRSARPTTATAEEICRDGEADPARRQGATCMQ